VPGPMRAGDTSSRWGRAVQDAQGAPRGMKPLADERGGRRRAGQGGNAPAAARPRMHTRRCRATREPAPASALEVVGIADALFRPTSPTCQNPFAPNGRRAVPKRGDSQAKKHGVVFQARHGRVDVGLDPGPGKESRPLRGPRNGPPTRANAMGRRGLHVIGEEPTTTTSG
jgi:hypothetical protein